jgi:CheY-like chemotaxis protein
MTAMVMIVDDIADNRKLLRMILEDDYRLCEASTGIECLSTVTEEKPDVILLDVSMPGITGYEVCRRLKANSDTAMIPVIFISAMDSPQNRLEGYEAGGDEYMVKPVNEDILISKVRGTLEVQGKHKALQQEAHESMNVALEAMTASSEMGLIVQFMKDCNECSNFEQLHQSISDTVRQFGLATCCQINDSEKTIFFDCLSQSLEAKVMAKCCGMYRIYNFGTRSVFSDKHISLLVKNMPLDEPKRLGRIQDNLAILTDIAEARIKSILMEMELFGRRSSITKSLIKLTESKLEIVDRNIIDHAKKLEAILQKLVTRLEDKLVFLGLEDDQERALRELTADSTEEIMRLSSFSEGLNSTLSDVLEGLYKLLENPALQGTPAANF